MPSTKAAIDRRIEGGARPTDGERMKEGLCCTAQFLLQPEIALGYKLLMLQRSKPARPARRTATKDPAAKVPAAAPMAPEAAAAADAEVPGVTEDPVTGEVAPAGTAAEGMAVEAGGDVLAAAPALEIASPAVAPAEVVAPPGPLAPAEPEVSPGPTAPAKDAVPPLAAEGGMSVPASAAAAAVPATTPSWTTARTAQNLMENTMQQANKATETMMKAAEEAAEFGRGNVEAFTKATQIYVAGMQDLGKQTFAMVQGLTDHAIEGAKALSGVKSLHEAAQIQSNFARAALEKSVTETAKLGEQALKLTEQAVAPITARFTVATEKLARAPIAA